MELRLSFKGIGEGYLSRIRLGIRWTRVVISRGQKQIPFMLKQVLLEFTSGSFGLGSS